MVDLTYTPDDDIDVHKEGAIKLLCRPFQSHENGLPELLKNSADAYVRENAPEAKRVIVIIIDHGKRGSRSSISCLDFSGMTSNMIEKNFRKWADPDAARGGSSTVEVQGGHGNGGKCYMTQMFDDFSVLHTVKTSKGNRYGVLGGTIRFGYIPDREKGRDFEVGDLKKELNDGLKRVRCGIDNLPDAAHKAIDLADGFTLVTGVSPKGYTKRAFKSLTNNLQQHPQMIRTLELCRVFLIVDNKLFQQGVPLSLSEIKPVEGREEPLEIAIPEYLTDLDTHEPISTIGNNAFPRGKLVLHTSEASMQHWRRKGRHHIIFRSTSGYIGYVPVPELGVLSPFRDRIYGVCFLDALDQFKQNDRARLARSPLTKSVEHFIAQQVEAYAKDFEGQERERHDQEEKDALSKINEALDRWKNQFLEDWLKGLWGEGEGTAIPDPPHLPTGVPARIELELSRPYAGIGVAFRPIVRFFDDTGTRIRAIPFRLVSTSDGVVDIDDDLIVINTQAPGKTSISAETLDASVRSNTSKIEVLNIKKIIISPTNVQIAAGSRSKLDAVCQTANDQEISDVYLLWTEDDSNIARVSSAGMVYGFSPGTTKVDAADDRCQAEQPVVVEVLEPTGTGSGEGHGRGFPRVLVSDVDPDPETGERVVLGEDYPPVYQGPRDVDRNIWWINSAAPLAKMYLDTSLGYGIHTREWRMYHLERIVDIMVQIALLHSSEDEGPRTVYDWIFAWGARVAEVQAEAAASLSDFISNGTLPGE